MTAATATANRPPTEAEIRKIVEEHKGERLPDPWDFAAAFTTAVDYIPEDERTGGVNRVWANLRPSEESRLNELLSEVYELASKELEAIEERLANATVAACMAFAAEYPDAPRALEPSNVVSIEDGAMALVSPR